MMNLYLCILIFLLIVYFYISYVHKSHESFATYDDTNMNNPKYYGTHTDYNEIHDEFYSFYYDHLFFDEKYYQEMMKVIFTQLTSIYNNHLILGMKHGGHICNMIDDQIDVECTSRSPAIIQKSIYNYPKHKNKYRHIDDYDTKFVYDPDSFTQISIIDNEIYYTENIDQLLLNAYSWLIHKGVLFVEVYDTEKQFMKSMNNAHDNNTNVSKIVYSRELTKINNNHYSLIEDLKLKNNKNERKNIHQLIFYHNDYIKELCRNMGLIIIDEVSIMNNKRFLIFRKSQ